MRTIVLAGVVVALMVLSGAAPVAAGGMVIDEAGALPPGASRRLARELADYAARSGNRIVVSILDRSAEPPFLGDDVVHIVVQLRNDTVFITIGPAVAPKPSAARMNRIVEQAEADLARDEAATVTADVVRYVRYALGDDVAEDDGDLAAPEVSGGGGQDLLVDSPAADAVLAARGDKVAAETNDADRVGLLALGGLLALVLVAVAQRVTGRGSSDVCPGCRSTLSVGGGELRCGKCGFRRVDGRDGSTLFGGAVSQGGELHARRFGAPSRGRSPSAGGASGSW